MSSDPMKAFGLEGGKSKVPGWLKLVILGVLELVLWGATQDFGLWLVLSVFFLGIGWACAQDQGNIILTVVVLVFATLLVGTRFGQPMKAVADGVKGIGDAGSESVGDLNIQLPSSGSPATTVPAGPAGAAGATDAANAGAAAAAQNQGGAGAVGADAAKKLAQP
jgi:hypothetical protein